MATGPGQSTLTPMSVVGELEVQRLRQPDDGELRRRVEEAGSSGDQAGARRGVDDVAVAAALDHAGHEGLDAVDDAVEVHADHPVPGLVAHAGGRGRAGDAGVVEQQRHRSEPGLDVVGQRGVRVAVAHVEDGGDDVGDARRARFSAAGQGVDC